MLTPQQAVIAALQEFGVVVTPGMADRVLYAVSAARREAPQDELLETPQQMVAALVDAARDGRSFTIMGKEYAPVQADYLSKAERSYLAQLAAADESGGRGILTWSLVARLMDE